MKIQRFFAADMRRTILKVREAMGPDAVIISNKRVEGGIEIVAAVDYDDSLLSQYSGNNEKETLAPAIKEEASQEAEPSFDVIETREPSRDEVWNDVKFSRYIPDPVVSNDPVQKKKIKQNPTPSFVEQKEEPAIKEMRSELKSLRGLLVNQLSGLAWGNETRYHPLRARMLQRLIGLGLSPTLARSIAEKIDEGDDFDHNWRLALGELSHQVPVMNDDIIEHGGVVALVGATGVGKTTTVAKLAARYILRHGKGKVGLISTDNYRVGAHEQLRSYSRIMGAPLRIATNLEELQEALHKFADKSLVLIDTAGMSQRDMQLNEQLQMLKQGDKRVQTYMVLATNSQRGVLSDVVRGFRQIDMAGCILTKVDETTSLGGALSVATESNLPIAYFNDGQKVPEDIHPARAHGLVSRAVSIMQHLSGNSQPEDSINLALGGMVAQLHG
ncbi:MAG: flagellar biosynthesis protein FlhF [Gammaproteobacteria bacterium]|nr:flagellar biosynthesis protein FlhF [Gammaproteobacteria bacterium]